MKIFNPLADLPANPLTLAIKEGYTPLLFAAAFSFVSNILYLALPLYTFQIYGRVMTSGSVATLFVLTLGVMGAFILSSVVDDYRARVLINYGVVLDQRVSGHIFTALFESAARGNPAAQAQVLRDLDTFRQMLTGITFSVIFDLPWMPLFMIVLFLIDPTVGMVTLVGAAVLFGITVLQDKATAAPLREANVAALRSYAFTDAGLRNSEIVRALGMTGALGRRWAEFRATAMERGAIASERSSVLGNISKFARMAIQVLIIAIGAYLVVKGKIHSGLLFANMILAARALQPIDRLVGTWDPLMKGTQAFDRLMEALKDYKPPVPGTKLPTPIGRLTCEAMAYAPPGAGRFVLQQINFVVEPGQMLGVVGPSGAGKSTLARLLVGIWKPSQGAVRLDGADVFSWDRDDFGRHVGYLPQDTELFAGSLRDNIARFRPDVEDEAVVWAAQAAGVHQLILKLPQGYDTKLDEAGHILSAGQCQRVGLARALLGNPRFIVLDEPNASLDADGEEALMAALDTLKAGGSTIVVVSHKPSILRSADKMLVLREGRIELFGPREQVMARITPQAGPRAVEAG
ncbi:type I secretion system permease/ATPase [Phenylobacterium aquaticum]|uniref:type I secretion system permease/ATPase n=1 Tax=Phenylobacterium aquaticum TaxID=1763816 RepID=UPI0026EC80DE|nr:type I secretion system permease/ATPase [Phenylobacterium aquaticum]